MDAETKKKPTWTDERVATLIKLWGEGLSASAIAKILGGVTRNAVIGKVHRLRLKGHSPARRAPSPGGGSGGGKVKKAPRKDHGPVTAPARGGALPRPAEDASPAPVAEAKPEPAVRLVEPPAKGRISNIMELNHHTCRWPIGDPGDDDFAYCGGKAPSGSPYCAHHAKMAYQPSSSQRRRANG